MPTMLIFAVLIAMILGAPAPAASSAPASVASPASQPSGTAQLPPIVPPFVPPEVAACDECDRITRDWQIEATAFARPLGEFEFKDAPLERVLDELARRAGLPIAVNWTDLENNGIERHRSTTLRMSGAIVGSVIHALRSIDDVRLRFEVRGGAIHLSTAELSDRVSVTCAYEIGELIVALGDELARCAPRGVRLEESLSKPETQPSRPKGACSNPNIVPPPEFRTPAEGLERGIPGLILPDSWAMNGGSGSLQIIGPLLVITNSIQAHREVRRLLESSRARAAQDSTDPIDRDWAIEQAAMSRPIGPISYVGAPLKQVLGDVARAAELPLIVNWEGLCPDTPIHLELPRGTVGVAVQSLFRIMPDAPDFEVRDGLLVIDERSRMAMPLVACPYDVGWLMDVIEAEQRRAFAVRAEIESQFPVASAPIPPEGTCIRPSSERRWDEYANPLDLIQTCIEYGVTPDDWLSNGGSASIRSLARKIVVRAPVRTHRELRRLLESLRDQPQKIIGAPKK